tara:strand:- start:834 stop:1607 length:774 start_codon:yes stop_codon:yes gene_type:complete
MQESRPNGSTGEHLVQNIVKVLGDRGYVIQPKSRERSYFAHDSEPSKQDIESAVAAAIKDLVPKQVGQAQNLRVLLADDSWGYVYTTNDYQPSRGNKEEGFTLYSPDDDSRHGLEISPVNGHHWIADGKTYRKYVRDWLGVQGARQIDDADGGLTDAQALIDAAPDQYHLAIIGHAIRPDGDQEPTEEASSHLLDFIAKYSPSTIRVSMPPAKEFSGSKINRFENKGSNILYIPKPVGEDLFLSNVFAITGIDPKES